MPLSTDAIRAMALTLFAAAPGGHEDDLQALADETGSLAGLGDALAGTDAFVTQFPAEGGHLDWFLTEHLGLAPAATGFETARTFVRDSRTDGTSVGQVTADIVTYLTGDRVGPDFAAIATRLDNRIGVAAYYVATVDTPTRDLAGLRDVVDGVDASAHSVLMARAAIDAGIADDGLPDDAPSGAEAGADDAAGTGSGDGDDTTATPVVAEGTAFRVTAADNAVVEGSTLEVTVVRLAGARPFDEVVPYTLSGAITADDLTAGTLTGALTIPAGSDRTTLSLSPRADGIDEPTGETLTLTLDDDPDAAVSVTVRDIAAVTGVTVSGDADSVAEATPLTVTVTLDAPATTPMVVSAVVVPDSVDAPDSGGSGTNRADFPGGALAPRTLTIPAGHSETRFSVTPLDDGLVEDSEAFSVTVTVAALGETATLAATVLDRAAAVGETFALTQATLGGPDSLIGTDRDDTFVAAPGTAETGDWVRGGGGFDRLRIREDGHGRTMQPTLTAVEEIILTNSGSAATVETLSAQAADGLRAVWAETVEDADGGGDGDGAVAIVDLDPATGLGIRGGPATPTARTDVRFGLRGVDGPNDAATLGLDEAAVRTVRIPGVETLTVAVSGAADSIIDGTLVAEQAAHLVLSGGPALTLDGLRGVDGPLTVDAAGLTGGLTLGLGTTGETGVIPTVVGSPGDDTIRLGPGVASIDSVDGGAGHDVIGLTRAAALTAGFGDRLHSIEGVDIGGASGVFDVDLIDGGGAHSTITTLSVSRDLAGATTITALPADADVLITAPDVTSALTIRQSGADAAGSDDDSLAITLGGAGGPVSVADLRGPDIETVRLVSTGAPGPAGHSLDSVTAPDATRLILSGDAPLTIHSLAGSPDLTRIDATALTAPLVLASADDGAAALPTGGPLRILGGSADDTLGLARTGRTDDPVVQGNGGADTIDLRGPSGPGHAAVQIRLAAAADSPADDPDAVIGFGDGDRLDLRAFGFAGAEAAGIARPDGVATSGRHADGTAHVLVPAAEAGHLFADGGADRGVAAVASGSDTWVFVDADRNGAWSATADALVLLAGVVAPLGIDDLLV